MNEENKKGNKKRIVFHAGPVDGLMGPQTRGALAAFQSDNGLAVTSAVDKPTLQTLGNTETLRDSRSRTATRSAALVFPGR
jgi:peptidoglycan hydrolase-like protein with peptidoglycan-binding domain